jgi:hypothetical protein
MTQDEVMGMAKKVGFPIRHPDWQKAAEEFAALVEEKATEKSNARANSSWTLMCEKMVALEREACAKVCDDLPPPNGYNMTEISFWDVTSLECAAAIRARGEQA